MNHTVEQFMAANQASLQALTSLTTQAFAGVEKLVELNLAASRSALGNSFSHVDQTAAYTRHLETLVTNGSAEFAKAVESKAAETQKAFGGVLENVKKITPAGSETARAAFKDAMNAGPEVQTHTQEVVETAQSNLAFAATLMADAFRKVSRPA
jgi:Phasin protein